MTHFPRVLFLPVFVAALLLAFTACDSGGSNSTDDGGSGSSGGGSSFDNSSSLTVKDSTGATISTLPAFSYFATGVDSSTQQDIFALYFVDDQNFTQNNANVGLFGIAVRNSALPSSGSYPVSQNASDFDNGSAFLMSLTENLSAGQNATFYNITSGDINITQSNSNRIDGSLTLTAEAGDFNTGNTQDVTITGSFQAESVQSLFGTGVFSP